MTAFDGGFNRWMQHTDRCVSSRSVADEVPHTNLLPDAQKAVMWERWKQGWTLHQIADLFNRAHTSVQGILARTGGIRPPTRTRRATALTLAEREEISRAIAEGQRFARSLPGRSASTVSRELRRNGGRAAYRASEADRAAWDLALRPKCCKLAKDRALAQIVADKLRAAVVARQRSKAIRVAKAPSERPT